MASVNMDPAPEVACEKTDPMSEVMELKTAMRVNARVVK